MPKSTSPAQTFKDHVDALVTAVEALPAESEDGISLVAAKTDVLTKLKGPPNNPQLGVANALQVLAKLAS